MNELVDFKAYNSDSSFFISILLNQDRVSVTCAESQRGVCGRHKIGRFPRHLQQEEKNLCKLGLLRTLSKIA